MEKPLLTKSNSFLTNNPNDLLNSPSNRNSTFSVIPEEKLLNKYKEMLLILKCKKNPVLLEQMKKLIFYFGIPQNDQEKKEDSIRGRIWLLFLGIEKMDLSYYQTLCNRNPDQKRAILDDTNRIIYWETLDSKDSLDLSNQTKYCHPFTFFPITCHFSRILIKNREKLQKIKIKESVARILNAFFLQNGKNGSDIQYEQALPNFAAAFLHCMDELSAFNCFQRLIFCAYRNFSSKTNAQERTTYACSLVHEVLSTVDQELADLILENQKKYPGNSLIPEQMLLKSIYFPTVTSFFLVAKPYSEAMKIWDFYICFGFHYNFFVIVAYILFHRFDLFPNLQVHKQDSSSGDKKKQHFGGLLTSPTGIKANILIAKASSIAEFVKSKNPELLENVMKFIYKPN